jgi:hypothetical protein
MTHSETPAAREPQWPDLARDVYRALVDWCPQSQPCELASCECHDMAARVAAALKPVAREPSEAEIDAAARAICIAQGVNPDWCVEGSGSITIGPDGKQTVSTHSCRLRAWQQNLVIARAALSAAAAHRDPLPDRTSPDDWPEAMLVTGDELHAIIKEHAAEALSASDRARVEADAEIWRLREAESFARLAFEAEKKAHRETVGRAEQQRLRLSDARLQEERRATAERERREETELVRDRLRSTLDDVAREREKADTDLKLTFKAVLHHFGPEGAEKVANSVLEARALTPETNHADA